jgi:hypothetical protein
MVSIEPEVSIRRALLLALGMGGLFENIEPKWLRGLNTQPTDQLADIPDSSFENGHPLAYLLPVDSIDWNEILVQLRDSGYAGVIGVECHPVKSLTAEALKYFVAQCSKLPPSG